MIYNYDFCKFRPLNIFKAIKKYKSYPLIDSGIVVFAGAQGQGKTSSLCAYLEKLHCFYGDDNINLLSNMPLTAYPDGSEITYHDFDFEQFLKNDYPENKLNIIILDEISVLFSSLESRNLPLSLANSLCQLRKARILILATSQVFGRLAKQYREQTSLMIDCHKFWIFQLNHVYDVQEQAQGEDFSLSDCKPKKIYFFIPLKEYDMYDTRFKIIRKEERKK